MPSSRPCPVCGTPAADAELFIARNIDPARLSEYSFASRKKPEFMNHQLVRCRTCDLVFVDEPPPVEELAQAYHVASYDSNEEAEDAANSYAVSIRSVLEALPQRKVALEIGTGTGIFLEHLKAAGFEELIGVEPSSAAIAAAPPARQKWIREGIFEEGNFEPGSIDLICCFMTMEHVRDPHVITDAALRLLRPGGALVTVTHDYRSVVNRLLGRRSPIIDIEHMQIFSRKSIRELFERTGFEKISVKSFANSYSLRYWVRLSPIPALLKGITERIVAPSFIGNRRLRINVGNSIAVGFRPK